MLILNTSVNNSLVASDNTPFRFGVNENGEYGYIVTDSEGADSVIPFKNKNVLYEAGDYGWVGSQGYYGYTEYGSYSFSSTGITVIVNRGNAHGKAIVTGIPIDLTNYSKIAINITGHSGNTSNYRNLFACKNNYFGNSGINVLLNNKIGTVELDVSDLSGNYYIGVSVITNASIDASSIKFDSLKLM